LEDIVELSNFGRSFFHSKVQVKGAGGLLVQEMMTAFVARVKCGKNDLKKSTPAASLVYDSKELVMAPLLLEASRMLRKGELSTYVIEGRKLDLTRSGLDLVHKHEASPYIDFNGANLLYYASYPTICDTGERLIIQKQGLLHLKRDWSLATSTKARDVFYYRNLDIGENILVRLNHIEQHANEVLLSTTLLAEKDGLPIADVFTIKELCLD